MPKSRELEVLSNEPWEKIASTPRTLTPRPSVAPVEVPDGLLRDVGVPDQEVLREADVGPEDREREHQLAQIVEVLVGDRGTESGGFFAQSNFPTPNLLIRFGFHGLVVVLPWEPDVKKRAFAPTYS